MKMIQIFSWKEDLQGFWSEKILVNRMEKLP